MPIKESLGLAQKLEECEKIALAYSEQSIGTPMQLHYAEIANAIDDIRLAHIGTKIYDTIYVTFEETEESSNE